MQYKTCIFSKLKKNRNIVRMYACNLGLLYFLLTLRTSVSTHLTNPSTPQHTHILVSSSSPSPPPPAPPPCHHFVNSSKWDAELCVRVCVSWVHTTNTSAVPRWGREGGERVCSAAGWLVSLSREGTPATPCQSSLPLLP